MKNRSSYAVLTRFGIIGAVLTALLLIVPAASAAEMIMYEENDDAAVARFNATDEEGDAIEWTLGGVDGGLFDISSGGELTFKSPPDFEAPGDKVRADDSDTADVDESVTGMDNKYEVTVMAAKGSLDLTVTVTNVDEDGVVKLNRPQPQVEILVTATLTDPDDAEDNMEDNVTGTTWQWAKSMDMQDWTDIDGATDDDYMPAVGDIGYYLRATATYEDTHMEGQTATSDASERSVEEETSANAIPDFGKVDADADAVPPVELEDGTNAAPFLRSVNENTAADMSIGNPVMATDADGDLLVYELVVALNDQDPPQPDTTLAGDVAVFDIDDRSGQIKTKGDLDFEDADNADDTYTVGVKVTDPSLATKTVNVLISVKDLNEAPTLTGPSKWTAPEVDSNEASPTATTLTAMVESGDPEVYATADSDVLGGQGGTDDTSSLKIEGPDKGKFELTGGNGLQFMDHLADYEDQKEYSITIVATDANTGAPNRTAMTKTMDVTIEVTNVAETGSITFTQVEAEVGVEIRAMLDDPDMGITRTAWQWYRGAGAPAADANKCSDDSPSPPCAIDDATSASYTPADADETQELQVRATYDDAQTPDDDAVTADTDESMAEVAASAGIVREKTAGNARPEFNKIEANEEDGTPLEDGSAENPFLRSVDEGTAADENIGNPIAATDILPEGDGAKLIYQLGGADGASFDITERGTGAGQIKTKDAIDYEMQSSYMVGVTAIDPSEAATMVMVMITVKNVNEAAKITVDDPADFPENGEGTVASFSATDEDAEDTTLEWSVDNDTFEITQDGVLTFASPPDFEAAESHDVTVKATAREVSGEKMVTVKIINMNEDGEVGLNRPQPQVEIMVTAKLTDPDNTDPATITGTTWQWSKSMDMTTWTDIDGATSISYTPAEADVGYYLRATATYADVHGEGQTASSEALERSVEEETSANAVPDFGKEDVDEDKDAEDGEEEDGLTNDTAFMRSVAENTAAGMNVGNPVAATDADADELLVYTLSDSVDDGAGDAAKFEIDDRTGQIKVKTKLDFEAADDADNADDDNNDEFAVVVTATDPSQAMKTAEVRITVMDVNEAPTFDEDTSPSAWTVEENLTALAVADDPAPSDTTYDASDVDSTVNTADTVTLTIEGPDKAKFELGGGGALAFVSGTEVDYETQSEFSITIVATDSNTEEAAAGRTAMKAEKAVKITVTNVDETGMVMLSQIQPQVGVAITATLMSPDGPVTGTTWQWARGDGPDCDTATYAAISDATSSTYTPVEADFDPEGTDNTPQCLRATATYSDAAMGEDEVDTGEVDESMTDTAAGVSDNPVDPKTTGNAAPDFGKVAADEDADPPVVLQDGSAENPFLRTVKENTPAGMSIEAPVAATDDLPTGDTASLIYTIGGPDGDSFDIDYRTTAADGDTPGMTGGQIKTKDALDFETKEYHMVEVTATDPSEAATTVMVMIMIEDVNEDAKIILRPADNTAPAFADDAATSIDVMENAPAGDIGDAYTADDEGDTVTYSVSGSMYIDVDASSGQLSTNMALDHEAMASHTVTITATDSDDATDTIDVTVTVGDMHPDCTVMDNDGLTNDCEALLDAKGDLGGDLDWVAGTAVADWEGVTMSDGRVSKVWLKEEGLDGSVSAAFGRVEMLTLLNLHSNSLSGDIPDLSGATMLEALYLPNNDLTGEIPAWLNGSTNLTNLWLWGNQLTGGIPDLSGLTKLDMLKLAGNMLDGNINAMYLPPNVTWLIIDSNGFDGEIPDLSGLASLELLWLHSNALTGEIPDGSMFPASVDDLNLRDNMLSGEIPDLSALDMATRVRLHGNMLTGEVPASLGDLDSLKQLWLWDNELTSINAGLGDLWDTLIEIGLNGNPWADNACVPIELADVATNDYEAAGIDVCGTDDGS